MRSNSKLFMMLVLALTGSVYGADSIGRSFTASPAVDIKVDGRLEERAWQEAQWYELDGKLCAGDQMLDAAYPEPIAKGIKHQAGQKVRAAILWDDKGVYFGISAEDQDVQAGKKDPNDWLWLEDVLEVFMCQSEGTLHYEFQLNACGTPHVNMQESRRLLPGKHDSRKLMEGIKTGVWVDGTLNRSADKDKGWSAEWFFSWEKLAQMKIINGADKKIPAAFRVRFASWDLSVYSIMRLNRYTLPGDYNPHQVEFYVPVEFRDTNRGNK